MAGLKLFYSERSPYVRKVRMVALAKGIALELLETDPHASPPELIAANPLGKVPALLLDGGTAIADSPVICEYLDHIGEGPALLPPVEGIRARTIAQHWHGVADGVIDAAVMIAYENLKRPPEKLHLPWVQLQKAKIERGLAELEQHVDTETPSLALISAICGMEYVQHRLPGFGVEIDVDLAAPKISAARGRGEMADWLQRTAPQSWG